MYSSSRKRKDPPSYRTAVRSGVRRRLFQAAASSRLGVPVSRNFRSIDRRFRKSNGRLKRRFRRRRWGRRGLGISRAKLVRALAAVNHKVLQSTQGASTGGSTVASGRLCAWFSGYGISTDLTVGLPNTVETMSIRDLFRIYQTEFGSLGTTRQSFKCYVRKWSIEHELTNMSTGYVSVRAYYCKFRSDVPTGSSLDNHVTILERGLRQELFGTTASLVELNKWSTTPYMAPLFCSYVKIYHVKHFNLESGQKRTLYINDKKTRLVNFSRMFTSSDTGTTPPSLTQLLSHVRGAKFILFQITGCMAKPVVPITEHEATVGDQHVQLSTTQRLTYSNIMDPRPEYTTTPAVNYTATLGTDRIILEDTDAVGVVTNA